MDDHIRGILQKALRQVDYDLDELNRGAKIADEERRRENAANEAEHKMLTEKRDALMRSLSSGIVEKEASWPDGFDLLEVINLFHVNGERSFAVVEVADHIDFPRHISRGSSNFNVGGHSPSDIIRTGINRMLIEIRKTIEARSAGMIFQSNVGDINAAEVDKTRNAHKQYVLGPLEEALKTWREKKNRLATIGFQFGDLHTDLEAAIGEYFGDGNEKVVSAPPGESFDDSVVRAGSVDADSAYVFREPVTKLEISPRPETIDIVHAAFVEAFSFMRAPAPTDKRTMTFTIMRYPGNISFETRIDDDQLDIHRKYSTAIRR